MRRSLRYLVLFGLLAVIALAQPVGYRPPIAGGGQGVGGAATLTEINTIPRISAAGVLGLSGITGSGGVAGYGLLGAGSVTVNAIATPVITSVTPSANNAVTCTYVLVARGADNVATTAASAAVSTAAGPTDCNHNHIVWTATAGASYFQLSRTVGGATQGLITAMASWANNATNCPGGTCEYIDTGSAASGSAPTVNGTGRVTVGSSVLFPGNATGVCQAASALGFLLNGTDETTAFNALMANFYASGGGCLAIDAGKTLRLDSQITIPKDGGTPWAMPPIRITGANASIVSADVIPSVPQGGSVLDLRYAGNRIVSLGQGTLEVDHLTIRNGGSACGAFFYTTLTNLRLHDNSILGANTQSAACEDVWIAGGTNSTAIPLAGDANDYFQGYGSYVSNNFADKIRRLVLGRVAFNSIPIVNNRIWSRSGSNLTTAITAATNAAAAVLTSAAHSFPTGAILPLTISGFTGNWTPLNGIHNATVLGVDTFSVAVDSTTFGAMAGSPVYLSGAAIEIDGLTFYNAGNYIAGNLIETSYYPFGIMLGFAIHNTIVGNSCWDSSAGTIACVWQKTGATYNAITSGTVPPGGTAVLVTLSSGPDPTNTSNIMSTRSDAKTGIRQLGSLRIYDGSPGGSSKVLITPIPAQPDRPFTLENTGGTPVFYCESNGVCTNTVAFIVSGTTYLSKPVFTATSSYDGEMANSQCSTYLASDTSIRLRCKGSDAVMRDVGVPLATTPGGMVSAWALYQLAGVANGVGGCTDADGCWSVNGGTAVAQAADVTQDAVLFALPAKGYVESIRIKTNTACTGATTANVGLGTTGTHAYYRDHTYDIAAAVSATNKSDTIAATGSDTAAATNVVASLVTTVENVHDIVDTCKIDFWVKWGVLP